MAEIGKEAAVELTLLRKGIIEQLDSGISAFEKGEITKLGLIGVAQSAWKTATRDEKLNTRMEEAMERMRLTIHEFAPINIKEHGDPIMQRYNPSYWLGDEKIREELELEEFVLERAKTLKGFFESL